MSAVFLKINPSARAAGKAADMVFGRGIHGVFSNPAALSGIPGSEVSLGHSEWFQGISHEHAAFGYPFSEKSAAGISVFGLFIDDTLEKRSGFNENIPEEPITAIEGKFGGRDTAIVLSYASELSEKVKYGFSFKVIEQVIDRWTGYGFGLDGGLKYSAGFIDLACAVKNFGQGVKFEKAAYNLPLSLDLGLGKKIMNEKISLETKMSFSPDTNFKYALGFEYEPIKYFILRGGASHILGREIRPVAGIMLAYGSYSLDYAWERFTELGDTHRINFSIKIPRQIPRQALPDTPFEKRGIESGATTPEPPLLKGILDSPMNRATTSTGNDTESSPASEAAPIPEAPLNSGEIENVTPSPESSPAKGEENKTPEEVPLEVNPGLPPAENE